MRWPMVKAQYILAGRLVIMTWTGKQSRADFTNPTYHFPRLPFQSLERILVIPCGVWGISIFGESTAEGVKDALWPFSRRRQYPAHI
jgi:hypothetical protein